MLKAGRVSCIPAHCIAVDVLGTLLAASSAYLPTAKALSSHTATEPLSSLCIVERSELKNLSVAWSTLPLYICRRQRRSEASVRAVDLEQLAALVLIERIADDLAEEVSVAVGHGGGGCSEVSGGMVVWW